MTLQTSSSDRCSTPSGQRRTENLFCTVNPGVCDRCRRSGTEPKGRLLTHARCGAHKRNKIRQHTLLSIIYCVLKCLVPVHTSLYSSEFLFHTEAETDLQLPENKWHFTRRIWKTKFTHFLLNAHRSVGMMCKTEN